ncbi:MAG: hypothetical protein D6765_14100, partial [Bacteroidetes bacterium]
MFAGHSNFSILEWDMEISKLLRHLLGPLGVRQFILNPPFMNWKLFVCAVLVLPGICPLPAQDCTSLIAEDKNIQGTHVLRTYPQTIVVRGSYSYSIEFSSDDQGVFARMYSKAGVTFNPDDEIIFLDASGNRRAYRFVGMGEVTTEGGTPVHHNTLQLNLDAVRWLSEIAITTIYIKNNVNNTIRKLPLIPNRQQALL